MTTTGAAHLLFFIAISSSSITSPCSAFAPSRSEFVVSKPATSPLRDQSRFSPLEPHDNVFGRRQPESSTALQMGIRSFIKKKILGRNSDEQDSDDNEKSEEEVAQVETVDVNLHALMSSPESAGLMEGSPNKYTEDRNKRKKEERNNRGNANEPAYSQEDIKQRIRRVKGGGMTEEEKMKFLNTALTRTSEKKKPRGPPIRQQIPGMDDADGNGGGSSSASKSSADRRLWDAITKKGGGGGEGSQEEISVASLLMDGKLKNEQAKRQYIASITNPDRFSSFSAMKSTSSVAPPVDDEVAEVDVVAASEEEEGPEGGQPSVEDSSEDIWVEEARAVDDTTESDFTRMKRQIAQDRELLNPKKDDNKSEAKKAVESILSMITQNDKKKEAKKNPTKDDALASRLELAAEEQEKRDAESRLAAEKKREEEKRQIEEQQRQREEEFRKKEEARIAAARQKAEDVRRQEEEKIAAEKAGVLARQQAQDDYWAKMLQKEKKKKGAGVTADQMRMKEVAARDREEKIEREVASNAEMERIREEERLREDPHEGEILKQVRNMMIVVTFAHFLSEEDSNYSFTFFSQAADARTRERERVRDIEILAAARVSRTVPKPSNEDVSASAFIAEQRRKKEEIDRLRKFDVEQLKSMNSPLPSPGKMKRQPAVKPRIGQVSPTMFRAPPFAPTTTTPKPPAPAPTQGLDLASLTMAKNKNQRSVASPPPSPPSSSAPPRLDIASLTMAKNTQNAGATKTPVKRVVRQRVQIDDDDDDDDDDDLMSAAPGMSIADAMKQQRKSGAGGSGNAGKSSGGDGGGKNISSDERAKQWGIDMSKFT